MAENSVAYPDLRRLLTEALDERRQTSDPLTIRKAARLLQVSVATLAAWKGGYRAPRGKNISNLAHLFYPDDALAQATFKDDLMRATNPGVDIGPSENILERPLKVRVINYAPLAIPDSPQPLAKTFGKSERPPTHGFLDEFVRRLLIYGDLRAEGDFKEIGLDQAVKDLSEGRVDIVAGIMATVNRTKHLRFVPTPITLPVNAVYATKHVHQFQKVYNPDDVLKELKTAIKAEHGKSEHFRIRPICLPDEIGGLYCRLALRLGLGSGDVADMTIPNGYDATEYLNMLDREARVDPGRFPLVVADELMCLKIVQTLSEIELLFKPGSNEVSLPRYSVGLAVPRSEKDWITFLEDVLPIYLRTDSHFLKRDYAQLFSELKLAAARTKRMTDGEAQEWAMQVLDLKKGKNSAIYDPNWGPLLESVRDYLSQTNLLAPSETDQTN